MIHHPLKEWVPSKNLPQIKRVEFLWVSKEGRRGTLVKGSDHQIFEYDFFFVFFLRDWKNLEDKFSSLPHEF
jgi:hypothetical protein